jgi:hypothetical protein
MCAEIDALPATEAAAWALESDGGEVNENGKMVLVAAAD